MCELLGMSFNQTVKPSLSFRGFRQRGKYNRDGWGVAFYPDKAAQIFKEPRKATASPLSKFLKDYPEISSKIFICHVRLGSVCGVTYMNTHPFSHELNGREYIFAHNGTLRNFERLPIGRFRKIGCTDSEHAFCHILHNIEERGITQWTNEDFRWLNNKLKEINNYGTFNCLFSDGELLFCYYDKNGYNGLCFVHRKAPYGQVRLLDEDFAINLAEEKDPTQTGFIIATTRLTNERWENFHPGELIVLKGGSIMFSSTGHDTEALSSSLGDVELHILKILRQSPHRVSLRDLIVKINLSGEEVKPAIHSLLCKGYIRQDRRDNVKWDNDNATFYTDPQRRGEIDRVIRK